jgi:hypothetical protein
MNRKIFFDSLCRDSAGIVDVFRADEAVWSSSGTDPHDWRETTAKNVNANKLNMVILSINQTIRELDWTVVWIQRRVWTFSETPKSFPHDPSVPLNAKFATLAVRSRSAPLALRNVILLHRLTKIYVPSSSWPDSFVVDDKKT